MADQNWRPVRQHNTGQQYPVQRYEPRNERQRTSNRGQGRTNREKRNRQSGLGINYNYVLVGLAIGILYAFWYITENEKASPAGYVLIGVGGMLIVLIVSFAIFMTLAKHISSLEVWRLKLFMSERKSEQNFDRAVQQQSRQIANQFAKAALAHQHARQTQRMVGLSPKQLPASDDVALDQPDITFLSEDADREGY